MESKALDSFDRPILQSEKIDYIDEDRRSFQNAS